MIHVLLDTNIYGLLIEDPNHIDLAHRIAGDRNLLIHNFRLIRNELRRTPKILPLYDRLVSRSVIQATRELDELAAKYFDQYKAGGGWHGQRESPGFRHVPDAGSPVVSFGSHVMVNNPDGACTERVLVRGRLLPHQRPQAVRGDGLPRAILARRVDMQARGDVVL